MFADTHCHIYAEYYDDIDILVEKIQGNKIGWLINNGCDNKSNLEVMDLIKKYDFMYGALGIHPEAVKNYMKNDLDLIEKNITNSKIVAIGEIGLDYHYGKDDRDEQIVLFKKQLELAQRYNLPVIIHSRDATEDTINILKNFKLKGVIHSFTGSYETAQIYLKMGFLLGINGVITFKNCKLQEVVERLSLKNIVLETDSPYLTPVPFRGQKNDSSHIVDIAQFIANLKNVTLEEVAQETTANARQLFDF